MTDNWLDVSNQRAWSFNNLSFLGSDRMDHLPKAHLWVEPARS